MSKGKTTDFGAMIAAARQAEPEVSGANEERTPILPTVAARASASHVPVASDDGPRYLNLIPKQVRLRADQLEALTVISRRLSRAKPTGGERITENTLIRVAVDALLVVQERLIGESEGDLNERLRQLYKL